MGWSCHFSSFKLKTEPIVTLDASTYIWKSFSQLGGISKGTDTNFHFKVLKACVHAVIHTGASSPFLSSSVKGMAIMAYQKINLR